MSLTLRSVSCKKQNVGFCFCIQSDSLCLFIGELGPLVLRDIKESLFFLLFFMLFLYLSGYLLLGLMKEGYYFAVSCV